MKQSVQAALFAAAALCAAAIIPPPALTDDAEITAAAPSGMSVSTSFHAKALDGIHQVVANA